MTFDGLEGVSVQYNHMDLPKKVLSGGATSVEYSYLADGTRTAALDSDGEGLVYRGPFTYRRSASGALTLEAAACPEGLLTDGEVLLHVTDHLGSTMAVMRGSDGALYEASEYDAYGKRSSLTVSGAAALPDGVTLRSGFTGKEDQAPDFGIGYTDFGARLYSPASRRWMVPDPLSEKYYGISPYAYCAGNPISIIDDGGLDLVLVGANNSSITFRTDLIDMSVNVGRLGIDWGGHLNLDGKETLRAALDIAGVFDPTGVADGVNAFLLASDGDYWGAFQSGMSVLPLGDLAKAPRISKDLRIIGDAIAQPQVGYLHRPYIRKPVREAVEASARRDEFGRFKDVHTNAPIVGKYDLGHKTGYEYRRLKAKAEAKGMTQKEFNDWLNNPDFYQIEDPHINRGHRYEKK